METCLKLPIPKINWKLGKKTISPLYYYNGLAIFKNVSEPVLESIKKSFFFKLFKAIKKLENASYRP